MGGSTYIGWIRGIHTMPSHTESERKKNTETIFNSKEKLKRTKKNLEKDFKQSEDTKKIVNAVRGFFGAKKLK